MRKSVRQTALLLCAVIASSCILSSCGNEATVTQQESRTEAPTEKVETTDTEEPVDNGRSGVSDSLPDDLDFEQAEARVVTRAGDAETKLEFYAEGEVGEVVNDAVYIRNRNVEERLNIKIVLNLQEDCTQDSGDLNSIVEKTVAAGSDEFEIACSGAYGMTSIAVQGYFYDLNEMDYLDFTQPWWNHSFLEHTGYKTHNYITMGELSLTMISSCYAMFFNRAMFNTFYPDDPTLYETVENGTWTLDKMISYCTPLYQDLNGDGTPNTGDRFGFYFPKNDNMCSDAMLGGCGISLLLPDENGDMEYGINENTSDFFEKIEKLLFENNNTLRTENDPVEFFDNLANGLVLFSTYYLSHVNYLRNMKQDYGIIPMPKLDESQKDYMSCFHDNASCFGVPITCENTELAAAFLEAMNAESYRIVTPAYFEVALKTKYSRDEETSHMLDMIVAGIYTDTATVFGKALGSPFFWMRTLFSSKSGCQNALTKFRKYEKKILKAWDKILDNFDDLDY